MQTAQYYSSQPLCKAGWSRTLHTVRPRTPEPTIKATITEVTKKHQQGRTNILWLSVKGAFLCFDALNLACFREESVLQRYTGLHTGGVVLYAKLQYLILQNNI